MASSNDLETLISDTRLTMYNKRCNPEALSQTKLERAAMFLRAQESLNLPDHVISCATNIIDEYAKLDSMSYHAPSKRTSFIAAALYIAANNDEATGRTVDIISRALGVSDFETIKAHTLIDRKLGGTKFKSVTDVHANHRVVIRNKVRALVDGSPNGSDFAKNRHVILQEGEDRFACCSFGMFRSS